MNIKQTIIAISLAAVPCAAFAGDKHSYEDHEVYKQKNRGEQAVSFDKYDQDNDGVLEETEVMDVNDKNEQDHLDFTGVEFENLDEDNDSEVSREEWKEYYSQN